MTHLPVLVRHLGLLDVALTEAVALAADRRAFARTDEERARAEARHDAYERLRYAVRAEQIRTAPLDRFKVWEYGEAVARCGAYSQAHPTTPLRDNPHFEEFERLQLAAFGAPWVLYHCAGCRLVTPRLDPSADFRTACCHTGIDVDWEPDWIDQD